MFTFFSSDLNPCEGVGIYMRMDFFLNGTISSARHLTRKESPATSLTECICVVLNHDWIIQMVGLLTNFTFYRLHTHTAWLRLSCRLINTRPIYLSLWNGFGWLMLTRVVLEQKSIYSVWIQSSHNPPPSFCQQQHRHLPLNDYKSGNHRNYNIICPAKHIRVLQDKQEVLF